MPPGSLGGDRLVAQLLGERQIACSAQLSPESAARTARKSLAGETSWRRKMCAPASTPWASAASVPARRSRGAAPVSAPMKSLREIAINSGSPSSCRRPTCGEQLDRLGGCLCEIRPRVDDELLGSHACGERQGDALAQEGEHLGHDVAVEIRVLHAFAGRDPRVHHDKPSPRLGAQLGQFRIAQAADIVDNLRPGGDCGASHRRLVGVHRDDRPQFAGDPLDERHDALDLLLHARPADGL